MLVDARAGGGPPGSGFAVRVIVLAGTQEVGLVSMIQHEPFAVTFMFG